MTEAATRVQRARLRAIAVQAMRERGLEPEFPPDAIAAGRRAARGPPTTTEEPTRDLRALLWCSIDNDDSRDLDQLSVAEPAANGDVKVLVAIADVDAAVPKGSPVDRHAAQNTTSVYTPAVMFPMLPERLSTDLTSLNDHEDRLAIVIEFVVSPDGDAEVVGRLRRRRPQPREARLQRRRRMARRRRSAAAGRRGRAGHRRAAAAAGRRRPGAQPRRARARRARVRDHRGPAPCSTATRCTTCRPRAAESRQGS